MRFFTLVALALSSLAAFAQPGPLPPYQNVVTLDGSATAEVPVDTLTVTLFTEEQGADPAELATRANMRLEQALARAKGEPASRRGPATTRRRLPMIVPARSPGGAFARN